MAELIDIETKLSAARTRLIIDKPFLGALVLRLPMIMADPEWCKTTATDAKHFYYNPEYIEHLNLRETEFVLAHEALHCALSHFARREHRVRHRWDLACDYAINPLLVKDGLTPPPGSLMDTSFNGMTAEEIYPYIKENEDSETLDQHVYDESNSGGTSDTPPPPRRDDEQGEGESQKRQQSSSSQQQPGETPNQQQDEQENGARQPPPLNHDEREVLKVQWQQRLAGAAQQALQAGKLSGDMARLVDFLLQPQLPWRMLLARYMNGIARDDYSYTRPSTRRGEPAIFPSLRSAQIDVVVALDTSGSISPEEMQEFVSEVDAIKGQMRARITLVACDDHLAPDAPWSFEPWEEFKLPRNFTGGGGTNFTPVFDWLNTLDRMPDLLVYFTDAEGVFPKAEAACPVIWLVKGKHKVPWGERIQLN